MTIKLLVLSSDLKEVNLENSKQIIKNVGEFINTDRSRNSLIDAIQNKEYQILWCLRGGYGAARILQDINQLIKCSTIKNLPTKFFIGFSDATAVNIFLYQNLGWNKVIHGMNYNQIADAFTGEIFDMNNFTLIDKILDGTAKSIIFNDLNPLGNSAKNLKSTHGKITGGNLSILQTSIGTIWEIDTANRILIIEDVDEISYRIDRMLEHLYQAQKLNSIKALVFGTFDKCEGQVNESLNRFASLLDTQHIPVFKTELIGHGYHNYPFIYGANTEIRASEKGFIMDVML